MEKRTCQNPVRDIQILIFKRDHKLRFRSFDLIVLFQFVWEINSKIFCHVSVKIN